MFGYHSTLICSSNNWRLVVTMILIHFWFSLTRNCILLCSASLLISLYKSTIACDLIIFTVVRIGWLFESIESAISPKQMSSIRHKSGVKVSPSAAVGPSLSNIIPLQVRDYDSIQLRHNLIPLPFPKQIAHETALKRYLLTICGKQKRIHKRSAHKTF
jgi:hypothetical protein